MQADYLQNFSPAYCLGLGYFCQGLANQKIDPMTVAINHKRSDLEIVAKEFPSMAQICASLSLGHENKKIIWLRAGMTFRATHDGVGPKISDREVMNYWNNVSKGGANQLGYVLDRCSSRRSMPFKFDIIR